MRIAFLAKSDSANALYRAVIPMSALIAHGHQVRAIAYGGKHRPADQVQDIDVLHVHRFCDDGVRSLMRHAQRHGAVVVWDDDDDAGSDKGAAHRRENPLVWERRRASVNRVLEIADLVTTPSRELAERFAQRGARNLTVIENYVPGLFLQATPQPHDGVRIGWVAGGEHQYDAEALPIVAVLQRLLDERPEVSVTTIGLRLDLRSDRYEHVKSVSLLDKGNETRALGPRQGKVTLAKMEAGGLAEHTAGFDIGIAPLADSPFNRARSNVKLKEYAAAGTPWLASPVGAYAPMGESQGGRLVADDGWHEALARLIDKPRERRKLAKRALKWATGETIEQNAHRWEAALGEAIARGRDDRGAVAAAG